MRMCNHKIVIDIMYITYYVYGHYKISSRSVIGNFHVCGGGGQRLPIRTKKVSLPSHMEKMPFTRRKNVAKGPIWHRDKSSPIRRKK